MNGSRRFSCQQCNLKMLFDRVLIRGEKSTEQILICIFNHSNLTFQAWESPSVNSPDVLHMHIPLHCVDLTYHNRGLLGCRTHTDTHMVHASDPCLGLNGWGNVAALHRSNTSCVSAYKTIRLLKLLPLHNNCIFPSMHHESVFLLLFIYLFIYLPLVT